VIAERCAEYRFVIYFVQHTYQSTFRDIFMFMPVVCDKSPSVNPELNHLTF